MRKTVIIAALAFTIAGCSSTTPAPSGPTQPTSGGAAPASSTSGTTKLSIGSTATLSTPSGPLDVTVVQVVDPATPAESYIHPTAGERWIGVQFKFVNRGTKLFTDSPLAGLSAADPQGQPEDSYPDQEISAGPMIDPVAGVRLQPGDTTLGFIVYSLPGNTKMARIQYTPKGGSTAEWALG